ncbi:MAG: sigma-70 family RNA polymerase sigma factor [Bacteroidota bacterium]
MSILNLKEDDRLLPQLKKPNPRLEYKIYRKWRGKFRATLIKKYHCPEEMVEEVYSEAFTITIQNIQTGKLDLPLQANLLTYCISVGKNILSNSRPKKHTPIPMDEDVLTTLLEKMGSEGEDPDFEDAEVEMLVMKIQALLEQMGQNCQDSLKGKYWYNYSHRDMMEEFNLPNENASRQRLHKCLAKMRKKLIGS